MGGGIAGIQGPVYAGSGCFHTRRVMYGLSVDDLDDDGNISSLATSKFLWNEMRCSEKSKYYKFMRNFWYTTFW